MLNFFDTTTETLFCSRCCKKQLFCTISLFTTEVNKIRLATTQVRPGPGRGTWGVPRLHFRILPKKRTLGMNCHSSGPGLHFTLLLLRSPQGEHQEQILPRNSAGDRHKLEAHGPTIRGSPAHPGTKWFATSSKRGRFSNGRPKGNLVNC